MSEILFQNVTILQITKFLFWFNGEKKTKTCREQVNYLITWTGGDVEKWSNMGYFRDGADRTMGYVKERDQDDF